MKTDHPQNEKQQQQQLFSNIWCTETNKIVKRRLHIDNLVA